MHKTAREIDAARRLQLSRRARRGLVAGYIHALSARHGAEPRRNAPRVAEQPTAR